MKINPSIFKSYDIRGIYPTDLNEETAELIGRGFVEYTGAKKVVVGKDMRLSSPALFEALTKGMIEQGADVYNMGEVPTEFLYFSVSHYEYDGGVMITASHNASQYNGFKMIKKETNGFSMIRGKDIIDIILPPHPAKRGSGSGEANFSEVQDKGKIEDIDVWQDYLNHIFSLIDVKETKAFKVVIDAGNGMAGKVIPELIPKLPIKVIPLNFKLDGSFPAHPSNALEKGATDQVSQTVREEKADFGFIFDGDADRIYLIDEKGGFILADVSLLLLAKYFLEKNPGAVIAYNTICSKAVPEFIEKWGGKPVRTKVGFVNVREGLIKNNGIMGGELSGHYCFKDNFYGDSGFIAFLILLQVISKSGKKVSEMIAELSPYAKASEINFEIEDKQGMLNKVKEKYSDGKQDYLDGVTVEYDDWWFNLRPSQTEPFLRLTIEAETEELLEEKKKELSSLILNT